MACDLCGKQGSTVLCRIEGMNYRVCSDCAAYGTVINEARPRAKEKAEVVTTRTPDRQRVMQRRPIKPIKDTDEAVREDFGRIIRQQRQASGKKMSEYAKLLAVKESQIHAWETGQRTPTIEQAKKLERKLHVRLTDKRTATGGETPTHMSDEAYTIADLLDKPKT